MKTKQLFLFSDKELNIKHNIKIEVSAEYLLKVKRRKSTIKQKMREYMAEESVLDDELLSQPVYDSSSAEKRLLIQNEFDVPEVFLHQLESEDSGQDIKEKLTVHTLLSKKDEHRLLVAYCEARNNPSLEWLATRIKAILIRKNLRLIGGIISKRFKKYIGQGVEEADIFEYGVEGLNRAIVKFDITKKCCLSTYATNWITQSIQRRLDNESDMIRTPVHYHAFNMKIKTAEEELQAERKEITITELSRRSGVGEDKIKLVKTAAQCACSIDAAIDTDEEGNFVSLIKDETQNTEEQAFNAIRKGCLDHAISQLNDEEQIIIKYRYGLIHDMYNEKNGNTYKSIAKKLHITIDEVKRYEQTSLLHLKEILSNIEQLSKFM